MVERKVILVTSNQDKIEEFQKYFPDMMVQKGLDLNEVHGTHDEVVIYKSIETSKFFMVEDTILKVNGKEVVDIRYNSGAIKNNDELEWVTKLGYNNGKFIQIFTGSVKGYVNLSKQNNKAFGFDSIFVPFAANGNSLYELGIDKREFSARVKAIENFKISKSTKNVKISKIPVWHGLYQKQGA